MALTKCIIARLCTMRDVGGADGSKADHRSIGRCHGILLTFVYCSTDAGHQFLGPLSALRAGNGPIVGRWVPYSQAASACEEVHMLKPPAIGSSREEESL